MIELDMNISTGARLPFKWRVRFDEGEVTNQPGTDDFTTRENFAEGGMIGFYMDWFQSTSC